MKVCGIILNYFGHSDTIRCVRELLNQNDLEKIIIVENSACNAELRVLKKVFKNKIQVEIISTPKNLGFSGGVNLAINFVRDFCFDAFLLLNNDTFLPTDSIRHLINCLINNEFDLVSPIIFCFPEKLKIWAKGYYYNLFSGLITKRNISFIPGTVFYLSGCCLLIHSKVLQEIGLFDTSFFMYGEDVEFCFRAVQNGFRIGIARKAHIYHKGSGSSHFNSLFYEFHINRCHFLLCNKLFNNNTEKKLSFAIKVVILAIRSLYRNYKYNNRNAILGYKQALFDFTDDNKTLST